MGRLLRHHSMHCSVMCIHFTMLTTCTHRPTSPFSTTQTSTTGMYCATCKLASPWQCRCGLIGHQSGEPFRVHAGTSAPRWHVPSSCVHLDQKLASEASVGGGTAALAACQRHKPMHTCGLHKIRSEAMARLHVRAGTAGVRPHGRSTARVQVEWIDFRSGCGLGAPTCRAQRAPTCRKCEYLLHYWAFSIDNVTWKCQVTTPPHWLAG